MKSRKRSAANSKPPDPPVFFLDRSLGTGAVAAALRAAGHRVVVHDEEFPQDALDGEWLPLVGERGWVVLTKDRQIRTRKNEIAALIQARVAAFVITRADLTGPEMAKALVAALPAMLRALAKRARPFVAKVTTAGAVEMLALPARETKGFVDRRSG